MRAARERILEDLLDQVDNLAQSAVCSMREEIPSYAHEQNERFFDDVLDQVTRHYQTKLSAFLEGRSVTLEDISFVRGAATRRARSGFALEDYLNAFRVGQQVLWDATVACAGDRPVGREAALKLAGPQMRYVDFASTHAAHAYVEYAQHVVADADRERRDLLEQLLSGEMPTRGPLVGAAQSYGLGPDTRMMVAVAVIAGAGADSHAPDAASAALARSGLREAKTLVVVRQSEIVALPSIGPGADPLEMCDRIEALQRRLAGEGMPMSMGISTVAAGVSELPRAYLEARAALECVVDEDGGVAALPRLTPFEYLAQHADDTAQRLVDNRLRTFLAEDRARGGVLTATIRAFAESDLNLRAAADKLQVHPNTAQYRMGRIEERTGRNPRRVSDLLDLLVAIALDDRVLG
ncbi:MAG TPA: helix-turn-helix domain-containing protein [Thermoleophilaceae bacterium]|nr:helix-turn-helix domain-containing protein [Thermoleophilaceae bacterium]